MKIGWHPKKLVDVCDFRPPKSEARKLLDAADQVSFVPMSDLPDEQISLNPQQTRMLSEVGGSYTYFANGDVLLAKITPCFENGKLGIAHGLANGVGFGSSEYFVLRPSPALYNRFLYYYLSRQSFRDDAARRMTGAIGHRRVPKELVEKLEIPVPPLDEQKRIVAILDQAFASIAIAKANTEKNLANAREILNSVRMGAFIDKHLIPFRNLVEVCENLDSQRIPITKRDRESGEIPYYGASGIVDHVAKWIFDEDLLLVSEDGANLLMRTYPIAFSVSGKCWVNNHAHVLRFKNLSHKMVVEYYLNSISLAQYVTGMAQPKLNQKALNSIPVPCPDDHQCREILNLLDSVAEQSEQLEANYRQRLTALREIKQALLNKAFTGQLIAAEPVAA